MKKIGRNAPCPCGSGEKFKRCHGKLQPISAPASALAMTHHRRIEAERLQRERQQGQGRPIIAAKFVSHQLVAVNNRIYHSKHFKTFHDFLFSYIKSKLGPEWGNSELAKPLNQRHPILLWYHHLCEYQRKYITEPGKVHAVPSTGAVAAYLNLAYDLYALEHNADLQKKLLNRLRHQDQFFAARYEVFVAAVLIRAGFTIAFEDEDDRNKTHCEFTATYVKTGAKFSVEAKHRTSTGKFRMGRQLCRALRKEAAHTRIVFIDVNVPDDASGNDIPQFLMRAQLDLRAFEGSLIDGAPLPDAYLFITNSPWHHHLEGQSIRCSVLAEGFQIPEFKSDSKFDNLRAAIDSRKQHHEMFALLQSLHDLAEVPSTFDGEIAELAFGDPTVRLLIGQRYLVKDANGADRVGLLTTATMSEPECKAYCGLSFEDGSAEILTWTMSEPEMKAWKKHPDTFFGEVGQRSSPISGPLELYDFFLKGYIQTPAERLLELLAEAPDIEHLRKLDQASLADIYAERLTNGAMAMNRDKVAQ